MDFNGKILLTNSVVSKRLDPHRSVPTSLTLSTEGLGLRIGFITLLFLFLLLKPLETLFFLLFHFSPFVSSSTSSSVLFSPRMSTVVLDSLRPVYLHG